MEYEQQRNRRRGDRRNGRERRLHKTLKGSWHLTQWADFKLHFETRYILTIVGIILFNWVYRSGPVHVSLNLMNLLFFINLVWISFTYFLVYRDQDKAWKARMTLWTDMLFIGFVVLNDPSTVPPTALAWIIIVMGNGMRFGMSMFREALLACFLVATWILVTKVKGASYESVTGISLQALFSAAIIVYAYVLTSRIDVTHRKVERNSRLDPLTSLLNRLAFTEVAESMLTTARKNNSKLAILFIDIDKFKLINDKMGHSMGDQVLCDLSQIIKGNLRSDDAAARYGGDEFVLILNEADIESASLVADRIQRRTSGWVHEKNLDLSLSIGIAEAPTHGESLDELLRKVDKAMYNTKFSSEVGGVALAEA